MKYDFGIQYDVSRTLFNLAAFFLCGYVMMSHWYPLPGPLFYESSLTVDMLSVEFALVPSVWLPSRAIDSSRISIHSWKFANAA